MAELQRPNVVGLGQLGDILSLSPRQPAQAGLEAVQGATQGTRLSQQSNLIDAQTGASLGQHGGQLSAYGQELLKPLQQLAQAREVIQAQDVAVQAALDMRAQVQSLKSSGTPHMEWTATATKGMDEVYQAAIGRAKGLSPAAEEYVTRELQQERLRLTGQVQGEVFKAEADNNIAALSRLDEFTRQEFFRLGTGEERAALVGKLVTGYRVAAQTGLIRPEVAEAKLQEFHKWREQNVPVYLADQIGLNGALEYINNASMLSPDEKRQAESHVISYVHNRLNADEALERKKEKALKLEQDFTGQKMLDKALDPKTTIEELNTLISHSTDLVDPKKRGLRDEQAQIIRKAARDQIETRTKGVDPKDDDQVLASRYALIVADGHNMDLTTTMLEILNDSRIPTAAAKTRLIDALKATKDAKNFRNSVAFKGLISELRAVEPTNMLFDPNKSTGQTLGVEIQSAINQLDQVIGQAAGPNGYMDDYKIRELGAPLVKTMVEQLRAKKTPNAGLSFDDLQTLGR